MHKRAWESWKMPGAFLNVLTDTQNALKGYTEKSVFKKLIGLHASPGIPLILKRAANVYYFTSNLLP